MLDAAIALSDLIVPPNNQLEAVKKIILLSIVLSKLFDCSYAALGFLR
jgi:hypothetical protein